MDLSVWYLVGAVLVFFMQCGFAMAETGSTRAKNAGNIILKILFFLLTAGERNAIMRTSARALWQGCRSALLLFQFHEQDAMKEKSSTEILSQ